MNTVSGNFTHGLKIGETVHKSFVVRELTVDDMVEAEKQVSAQQIHAFNVEQLSRALVQVGDTKGPFVPAQIRRLRKTDYYKLLNAMNEAETLGEDVQDGTASS